MTLGDSLISRARPRGACSSSRDTSRNCRSSAQMMASCLNTFAVVGRAADNQTSHNWGGTNPALVPADFDVSLETRCDGRGTRGFREAVELVLPPNCRSHRDHHLHGRRRAPSCRGPLPRCLRQRAHASGCLSQNPWHLTLSPSTRAPPDPGEARASVG